MKQHTQTLNLVLDQAFKGKGIRHGGNTIPFNQQPWLTYARSYGVGFLAGQANKKLEEAFIAHHGQDRINEMLGAITYLCMVDMFTQGKDHQWGCDYILDDYIAKLSVSEGMDQVILDKLKHLQYIYGPSGLVQQAAEWIKAGDYRAAIQTICMVIELYQDEETATESLKPRRK